MRKALFLLTLLYSYSFALDIYGFNMGERYITLNDGEIRRFDGDALQFFSSYFEKQFIYQGPENSTFIVADNRLVTDKSYNMRAYIIVDSGRLVMNLNSTNSNGVFALDNSYLHGVYFNFSNNHTSNYASFTGPLILANPGSTIDITTINTFFIGRGNLILDNSTINITNVKRLINQTLADHGATIINHSGTLYIGADVYNYYYIDQEFYYMGKAYTRETHGGHFYQSAGTSTIKGSFYNGGTENIIIKDGPYPGGEFDPTAPQERLDALVEIENGGKFTVNGNFENGKNDPSIGCIDEDNCDYLGYLVAKGGSEIIVGGDFKSDAQGDSFVSNGFYYRSSVDLQDSTLKVGGSFSAYRSNISLTGNSSIHANSFFLDHSATLNFIGSDTGFSFINATTSATFNGSVSFQLTGSLLKNDDMSYLILLAFCDVNTGCSSDEGGDGNQGGNEGGSDDKPTPPSPNTPPSSDPIY
ncbi:hypothetical protein, partial [Campylobacter avium]